MCRIANDRDDDFPLFPFRPLPFFYFIFFVHIECVFEQETAALPLATSRPKPQQMLFYGQ